MMESGRGTDEAPVPKTGFDAFRGTPLAIILGIILGVGAALVFMYTGVYYTCCFFMGYLIVALVLYYLPKLLGADKVQWQAIVAVLFFVCSSCFGAMVVSPDAISHNEWHEGDSFDSSGFSNLHITEGTTSEGKTELVFTFYYDSECGGKIGVQEQRVKYIHYNNVNALNTIQSFHGAETKYGTEPEGKSTYEVHVTDCVNDSMYHFKLVKFKEAESTNTNVDTGTKAYLYDYHLSDNHKSEIVWLGNCYQTGIVTGVFVIVCVLMFLMNRYLAKAREKMEAEGRLYPQGYGRCKECGTMVLPGETCCRKCGAYVDIPDEMRVKKVDSFHCSDCGAEVPADALCCPRCGAKFDEDDEVVIVDKDGKSSETIEAENQATEEKPAEEKPAEETPAENKEEEKKE